jgi:hypothetical protein
LVHLKLHLALAYRGTPLFLWWNPKPFHVSIAADDPKRTAEMIAELWRGRAYPFPPVAKGSWVAMAGDARNSTVECYPRGTVLFEGEGEPEVRDLGDQAPRNGASHAAIATPLSVAEVKAVAERYGVSAKVLSRGGVFHVIELWIDGAFMFEVLTPEFQAEYLRVDREAWEAMLARGPRPIAA